MPVYKWKDIPEEKMNNYLTRRYFHGDNITVALFKHTKGGKVPGHVHQYEQLIYVIKGKLMCKTDKEVWTAQDGEFLDIPPNIYHEIYALEDTENITFFSPPRDDWRRGEDGYLRG